MKIKIITASSILALAAFASTTQAQVTMTGSDAAGNSSFSGGPTYHWSNSIAPSAANDYIDNGFTLRSPANATASITFAGNSLTLQGFSSATNVGALLLKSTLQTGSTTTINDLVLDGGGVNQAVGPAAGSENTSTTLAGNIYLTGNGGTLYTSVGFSGMPFDATTLVTATIADFTSSHGNLTVIGTGPAGGTVSQVILTGTDTYSGTTTVGTLGNLQIGNGGTVGSINNTSSIVLNTGGSLSFNRSDAGLAISPVISGTGSVSQIGNGTTTLTSTNTYSGGTTISKGMLAIATNPASGSATGTGTVTLGAATLTGNGAITGRVAATGAAGASVITPGAINSIGNLTLNGGVASSTGLTLNMAINGPSQAMSTLTLGSTGLTVTGSLTFNLYDLGQGTLANETPYTLISGTGALTASSITANLLNSSYTLDTSYGTNGILFSGDIATFEVEAVPEPSAWTLLAGGLVILLVYHRRQAHKKRSAIM